MSPSWRDRERRQSSLSQSRHCPGLWGRSRYCRPCPGLWGRSWPAPADPGQARPLGPLRAGQLRGPAVLAERRGRAAGAYPVPGVEIGLAGDEVLPAVVATCPNSHVQGRAEQLRAGQEMVSAMEQGKAASKTAARSYLVGASASFLSQIKKAAEFQKPVPCLLRLCLSLCPVRISERPGFHPGMPSAEL